MNKESELDILRAAVAALGPQSYCGPWLAEQLAGIEKDIRSDFYPMHSRAQSLREIEQAGEFARTRNAELIANAQTRVAEIEKNARNELARIQGRAANALRIALKEIEA